MKTLYNYFNKNYNYFNKNYNYFNKNYSMINDSTKDDEKEYLEMSFSDALEKLAEYSRNQLGSGDHINFETPQEQNKIEAHLEEIIRKSNIALQILHQLQSL